MSQELLTFLKQSSTASKNDALKEKLHNHKRSHAKASESAKAQFIKIEQAKKRAKNRKWDAINNLENYLLEFEANFISRGGKVIWAEDAEQAFEEIHHILKRAQVRKVVKSKSMVTEEIDLNRKLEGHGIHVTDTDLGDFINQLAAEKPSHLVMPALHKSKEDIDQLFSEKLGTEKGLDTKELAEAARQKLRQEYLEAEATITGANFLIADTGSVSITENEANVRSAAAWPRIMISVAGIEKILPAMEDLELFWPLLSSHATGQKLTSYNSLFSGTKMENEEDGPAEAYVILLDNGRTKLLEDIKKRESLYCIKCGACLNVCPVYNSIGGEAYDTTYPGPIGAVISPALFGNSYNHLSQASTICGECSEVCPVKIPIHDLIMKNRADSAYDAGGLDKMAWKSWEMAIMNRRIMNQSVTAKNVMLRSFFKKAWGEDRDFPKIKVSFNQAWNNKYGS